MVTIVENEHSDLSSSPKWAVCISHNAITLGEWYESNYSASSYGLSSLTLAWHLTKTKENWIQTY